MQEILKNITETQNCSPVKDLRWLPLDNVIVGLVKDDYWSNVKIHEGYVSGTNKHLYQWNKLKKLNTIHPLK
jgi:hypothetical protein